MPLRPVHRLARARRSRRIVALGVVAGALVAPVGADAAVLSQNLSCTARTVSSPLANWGDTADYWLAPGGDFESETAGWALNNAAVVSGNETLGVLPGSKSLRVAGVNGMTYGTATTPGFCVDASHPSFRFLVKSTSPTASLATSINFRAVDGSRLTVAAKFNTINVGGWSIAQSQPLATAIPSIYLGTGTTASITFQVSTATLGSSVYIDDVLVDPYRRG